jgi:hypothetical protein
MKRAGFHPLAVLPVLALTAGAGWWAAGTRTPAVAVAPAAAARPVRTEAGKSAPDPVVEAASEWLRSTEILARRPRDFAAELKVGLGEQNEVLQAWLAADREACWAWFHRDGWRSIGGFRANLVAGLLKGHEADCFALVQTLPEGDREALARATTEAALRMPPAQAAALLVKYGDLVNLNNDSFEVGQPLEVLKAIGAAWPAAPGRSELLFRLMGKSARQDPAAAAAWWRGQPAAVQAATAVALLSAYQAGPKAWDDATMADLIGVVLDNSSPGDAGEAIAAYVNQLAASDPVTALQWAVDTFPVDAYENIAGVMSHHWTAENLVRLAAAGSPRMVDEVLKSLARDNSIEKLAGPLLEAPAGSAERQLGVRLLEKTSTSTPLLRKWVEQAPASEVPAGLLWLAADDKVKNKEEPGAVFAWLARLDGKPVGPAARLTADNWLTNAPEAAAPAIAALPPGPVRRAAIMGAAGWLARDYHTAAGWLEQLPAADRPLAVQVVRLAGLTEAAQRQILDKWGVPTLPPPPNEDD